MATIITKLHALVDPILTDLAIDLYDLEYAGGVIRLTIDREGGVDLEAITDVTRNVSRELDHVEFFDGPFSLEVSSPGLERNLRTPLHFQRARGSTVSIKLLPGSDDAERRVEGTLSAADDDGITVIGTGGARTISYARIDKARTVFVWGGQPKPGERTAHPATPEEVESV
jgi:ribosome maturation factor RimP